MPRLVSNIRVSQDYKYVGVGFRSGRIFVYEAKEPHSLHREYEMFHHHTFQVTDILFIKGGTQYDNVQNDI